MESFHQNVIKQIRPFLTNVLDVSDVISGVRFLSPREREQIKKRLRYESKPEACALFLEILHHHSVGSFVEFYCSVKKHRPDVANYILSEVPAGERHRFQDSQNDLTERFKDMRVNSVEDNTRDLTERFKGMLVNSVEDNTRVDTSLEDIPQRLWDRIETIVRSEYGFEQLILNLPRRQFIKTKGFTSHDEFSQLIDMLEREGWTIKRFIDGLVMNIDELSVIVKILDILKDYHNYDEVINLHTNQPVVCQDGSDNVYAAKNADMEASNIRREPSQQHVLVPSETECDQTNIPSSYVGAKHIQPERSDTFGNVQGNLEGTENSIPKTIDDRTSITNMSETSPLTSLLHRPGNQYASPTEVTTPYHLTSQWGDAISVRHRQHFQAISDIITRSTVIRRWKELARDLKITDRDIVAIDEEHSQLYERCYQMLLKWKQTGGTPRQLMKALIDIGHQEEAVHIEEYLKKNSL